VLACLCVRLRMRLPPFMTESMHTHCRAEWKRACKFLATSGANYGLSGATPSDLDETGKETLLEVSHSSRALHDVARGHVIPLLMCKGIYVHFQVYASDPAAAEGPIRIDPPESLR
jgi:hypothetical protein